MAPKQPHFRARAKNVIYLFMAGAPSHLELFDHKPQLAKFSGTLPPPELIKGYRAAFINPSSKLLGPKFRFGKYGENATEISELLPHLATIVDDITIVKSMVTDAFNHAPAQIMMNTGAQQFGRPEHGRLGDLRAGQRVARPAGLRRLQLRQEGPERRELQLGLRLPPDGLPGRAVPRHGRPGALPVQPAGRRRALSATRWTR
jgi:hypothetical protein